MDGMKTLQIIAVAWYKADQWAALKCASVDDIEETYLEWIFNAEKTRKPLMAPLGPCM